MTLDLHQSFRRGAESLVHGTHAYSAVHREHGISQVDWELLTDEQPWSVEESRRIRSVLAATIEVCMTVSGMPPVPLPAQYAAAIIAVVVAPANRMVAAMKCPDTFDAHTASGLMGTAQVVRPSTEQMMALVMAYSGGYGSEPMKRLDNEIVELVRKENKK